MKKIRLGLLLLSLTLLPRLYAESDNLPPPDKRGAGPRRDGDKPPHRQPPPPVMEYLTQLKKSDPDEFNRLETLREENPREFRNELRKNAWKKSEGKKNRGLSNRPHPLEAEIEKVRSAESPEAKAQAVEELRSKVRTRVEKNLEEREAAIEKFRQQLKKLEEQNEQERIRLEEIIDHHLDRILKNLEAPSEHE